ncbi:hypothetical protein VTO42DRAFT_1679 [Malbranchea cinnamomea]
MASLSAQEAIKQLKELDDQNQELSILKISEPVVASSSQSPSKRSSDVSTDTFDNPTPASLEADLTHYKELFSKLRFSYVEQVTKEKFLRAIVGDPPLVVGHNENVELEAQLAQVKEELRGRKEEVRKMIEELGKMGRELARRYEKIQLQTKQLSELPESIENLESTIKSLREKAEASQMLTSGSSSQTLPLADTLSLLAEREAELQSLDRQLAAVGAALPRKTREAEAMEREIYSLQRKRNEVVAQAKEARRKKEEGESDGLEEMGRWYRGVEKTLNSLLGAQS